MHVAALELEQAKLTGRPTTLMDVDRLRSTKPGERF